MAANPLPKIDEQRCTGCRRCVEVCPTEALDQLADKAYLRYPDRCHYCMACEEVCPTNAISLPFVVVLSKNQEGNVHNPKQ